MSDVSSGTFLIGAIASTNSRDQPSASESGPAASIVCWPHVKSCQYRTAQALATDSDAFLSPVSGPGPARQPPATVPSAAAPRSRSTLGILLSKSVPVFTPEIPRYGSSSVTVAQGALTCRGP